jgi:hypothetical protein
MPRRCDRVAEAKFVSVGRGRQSAHASGEAVGRREKRRGRSALRIRRGEGGQL